MERRGREERTLKKVEQKVEQILRKNRGIILCGYILQIETFPLAGRRREESTGKCTSHRKLKNPTGLSKFRT